MVNKTSITIDVEDLRAIAEFADITPGISYVDAQPVLSTGDMAYAVIARDIAVSSTYVNVALYDQTAKMVVTSLLADPFFVYRLFADTYSLTDTAAVAAAFNRFFDDTLTFDDSVVYDLVTLLSDAFTSDDLESVDDLAFAVGIRKTNLYSVIDAASILTERPLSDLYSVTDVPLILRTRYVLDNVVFADIVDITLVFVPTAILNAAPLNTFDLNG